jgi:hypothetical protein
MTNVQLASHEPPLDLGVPKLEQMAYHACSVGVEDWVLG